MSDTPLDGRMMLGISRDEKEEPRMSLEEEEAKSQQFFAVDVDGLAPGQTAVIDGTSLGYPKLSLADIPAGDYYVQALLNRYQTYRRADGHTIKLPPDMGEGQKWNEKPGNLYSKPVKIHVDPKSGGVLRISLTEKIGPIEPPKDTKYIKHVRMQSKLLTEFWGTPTFIGAHILLPEGFDEHRNAHYPIVVYQDHFSKDFRSFRSEPPKPELKGRELASAEAGYKMYQDWTSGRLPKVIIVDPIHPNPYYDGTREPPMKKGGAEALPSLHFTLLYLLYSSLNRLCRLAVETSCPWMKMRFTSVFTSNGSPVATTTFAVLPTSSEPS
jgi:hypothetical protein